MFFLGFQFFSLAFHARLFNKSVRRNRDHRLLSVRRGNILYIIYPSWPKSFRCKAVRDRGVADLSAWQRLSRGSGRELEECDKWPSGGGRGGAERLFF